MRTMQILGILAAGLASLAISEREWSGSGDTAGRLYPIVVPPKMVRRPMAELVAASATAPALDTVYKATLISLKTKGHTPIDGFDMLGKATGVTFVPFEISPGRSSVAANRAKEALINGRVDYDLERVGFWEAALRLGETGLVNPRGNSRLMRLQQSAPASVMTAPIDVLDTPAMRVMLFRDSGAQTVLMLEFLLDPRLAVLTAGDLQIETATDNNGKRLQGRIIDVCFPGNLQYRSQHGALTLSSGVDLPSWQELPADCTTLEVLRGYLPVVVATKKQALEYAVVEGKISDLEAHRVGDWLIRVTGSRELVPGVSVRPQPDHEITLKVERLTDTAPPFPTARGRLDGSSPIAPAPQSAAEAIGYFAGSPGVENSLSLATSADGKSQEWTVRMKVEENEDPVTKLIIDVPVEAKAVVLPFEFKKVSLRRQ